MGGHGDISQAATCCHQWPFQCLWSGLMPEAMLMSGCVLPPRAISGSQVLAHVCGPCYHESPYRCPWSGLLTETMLTFKHAEIAHTLTVAGELSGSKGLQLPTFME